MVWFPRAYFLGCFLPYYCLRFRFQMRAIGEILSDPLCITIHHYSTKTTLHHHLSPPRKLLTSQRPALHPNHPLSTPRPSFSSLTRFSHSLSFFLSFPISHIHSLKHPLPIPTPPSNSAFLSPSFLPLPSSYMHPIRPSAHQSVRPSFA